MELAFLYSLILKKNFKITLATSKILSTVFGVK